MTAFSCCSAASRKNFFCSHQGGLRTRSVSLVPPCSAEFASLFGQFNSLFGRLGKFRARCCKIKGLAQRIQLPIGRIGRFSQ
jgi:hypothetical protein